MTDLIVRRATAGDRRGWDGLYAGYAAFYGVEQDDAMRDRVWSWIHNPGHDFLGYVAERDGALVGLAHVRVFARPLTASVGGFLDDLFVAPEARGAGVGRALIEAAAADGRERGWTVLRWITASDNATARALYDEVAAATRWVTYDIALG